MKLLQKNRIALCFLSLSFLGTQSAMASQSRIIIKLNSAQTNMFSEKSDIGILSQQALSKELNIYLLEVAPMAKINILNELNKDSRVIYSQDDHKVTKRSTPNDEFYNNQWSLTSLSNNADINAPEAWELTKGGVDINGNKIAVAVVDGGVDVNHPDLVDNIWTNAGEIADNGKDDDGNGYIDDVHGWNAYTENGSVYPDVHGTHVAGIIGAKGNNSQGVSGLNWNTQIVAVGLQDYSTSEVVKAYNYVLNLKKQWIESNGSRGVNIVATNSSFGIDRADCTSGDYPLWNDIYNEMGKYGILSAAATPNSDWDIDQVGDVPTGCDSDYIIAVTNTTKENVKYKRAGHGITGVDVAAPGTDIFSTTPNNQFVKMTGTSMATPHVAGLVALMHAAANENFNDYYQAAPDQAVLDLKSILMNSGVELESLRGVIRSGKRIDAKAATDEINQY